MARRVINSLFFFVVNIFVIIIIIVVIVIIIIVVVVVIHPDAIEHLVAAKWFFPQPQTTVGPELSSFTTDSISDGTYVYNIIVIN